ncbi:hypothetical protein HK097_010589 [Rhizophlyctis rosea]|uniref:Ammonium transporter AmtB-like domain-containing protein n=1 Tax=Rhizophlyctis rosea TaxID=64517 RepID=A0AAD5SLY9_9FUNG|nr:hypothetical protein HK097_010589 [Rhizophlyctis rosea]
MGKAYQRPPPPIVLRLGPLAFELFDILFLLWQAVMVVLYCTKVTYSQDVTSLADERGVANEYITYTGIAFMMYIGFGYLMTFLRRNGFAAVGMTFMVSAVVMEWGILVQTFLEHMLEAAHGEVEPYLHLNLRSLILGMFMVAPVLISFGAIIGKVSSYELMFVAFFEVIFVGINNYIANGRGTLLEAVDMGGSVFIHLFGAYFGLAVSYVLCHNREKAKAYARHSKNGSSYNSDLFSLLGTIALFIYWPSFNSALAKYNVDSGFSQSRVIINTSLAQSAGAFTTFIFSKLLRRAKHGSARGLYDLVDIQNATLAGAVSIGCASDLVVGPGGAMAVGITGALISTAGFVFLQPFLVNRLGLHDTCGIHNLHGLPGLFGGIVGIIAVAASRNDVYGTPGEIFYPHGANQPVYQLASVAITLAFAIISGAFTGLLVLAVRKHLNPIPDEYLFEDIAEFETPEEEEDSQNSGKEKHVESLLVERPSKEIV